MHDSLLYKWLEGRRLSVRALAEHLGVSAQAVYGWIDGSTTPTGKHLAILEELSNGEIRASWFQATQNKGDQR
mgnify:CR=1 FL=1